jgi:putative lipoprotein (rSAM/lipoprotein system)
MLRLLLKLVCLLLGAILGTACFGGAEYGMPSARYRADGKVVARKTQRAIPGIAITFGDPTFHNLTGEVVSKVDGTWSLDQSITPCETCKVLARDPDGPQNGGFFAPAEKAVALQKTAEGQKWDRGTFEAHGVLIELDESLLDASVDGRVDAGVDGLIKDDLGPTELSVADGGWD